MGRGLLGGMLMDWVKTLTRKDLVRFLEEMQGELAERLFYYAPDFVRAFCREHEDELLGWLKENQFRTEGDYEDII